MAIQKSSSAVFLSHASEDEATAVRMASALRAGGLEVWLDNSELRGGDAWDHSIRQQLRDCALFMPVISRHTTRRREAYFRLEWHLADQRTLLMAVSKAFIVPVCIDDTTEAEAEVPESFRAVQWTRLPAGVVSLAFRERIGSLLQTSAGKAGDTSSSSRTTPAPDTEQARVPADVIKLGPFELVCSERQLLRDGQPVVLGARAFDMLQVFAEHPGRLVSKATLLERVWPKLVVDENNIPAQIASLRRVLGATAISTRARFWLPARAGGRASDPRGAATTCACTRAASSACRYKPADAAYRPGARLSGAADSTRRWTLRYRGRRVRYR